jgi:hypothetical protein
MSRPRQVLARRARQAVLDFTNDQPTERARSAVRVRRARVRAVRNRSGRSYACS